MTNTQKKIPKFWGHSYLWKTTRYGVTYHIVGPFDKSLCGVVAKYHETKEVPENFPACEKCLEQWFYAY